MAHGLTNSDTMFSVREVPWHGKGKVLETYPGSIDEALDASGLGWRVGTGDVQVVTRPAWTDDWGILHAAEVMPAPGFKATIREDTGQLLGIVSDEYQVFDNRDAFRFLDNLIGSQLHYETAGSIGGGRRVWVLSRLPEWIELGGDLSGVYVFVSTAHDGTGAATSSVTPIKIVCRNTLTAALRRAEHGIHAERTYRIRHTGDLTAKVAEARNVMGMTINYAKQFKALADDLALQPITSHAFETRVLRPLWPTTDDMGKIAKGNRDRTIESILDLYRGKGKDGDTRGNSPGTKWCAYNAIGEHQDWNRRYTKTTDQVARSFYDDPIKTQALDLLMVA